LILALVLSPLAGANKIPIPAPMAAPPISAINVFPALLDMMYNFS
jgi:hypothetical protein